VVSWDLLPRGAISSVTLLPGSNPLFGLNALGGAISVQTKNGREFSGTTLQTGYGSAGRWSTEIEHGGNAASGIDWYLNGNLLREDGWRVNSPSRIGQLFAKLGYRGEHTQVNASAALADNELTGNGLQEVRLLEADRRSVYTQPDVTKNRSALLNLSAAHELSPSASLSGNAFYRRIKNSTFNGDINEGSLDQSLYQPGSAERAALSAAGFRGFPTSGETAANTPFPFWRCIAQGLLNDEPGEKCNGLLNRTQSTQQTTGVSAQLNWRGKLGGVAHQMALGGVYEQSRVRFGQSTQLGYLNADRTITPINSFADGVSGGNLDGEPYDNRVDLSGRIRIGSVFATDTVSFGDTLHLTVSGRYNDVRVSNHDNINPGGGATSLDGDHRFRRFNPAVGVTWNPRPDVNAYASYSESSRAPTTIELGCANPDVPCKLPNALAGDPPLKQVIARTIELGVRGQTAGKLSWHVDGFRSDNRDDILFVADDQAGFGYFKNFGKTRRQGIELGADAPIGPVSIGLSYTYLDATFQSVETVNGSANSSNAEALAGNPGHEGSISIRPGNRIPLLPQHIAKLLVDYRVNSQWSLTTTVIANSSSYARGNENNAHLPDGKFYIGSGRVPGFATFNLAAQYQPTKSLQVTLRVNNLFDTRYATGAQLGATGFDSNGHFQARPFGGNAADGFAIQSSTFYAPGAPRQFWIGLKYSL
jgi:outer membrane receptor protein involved in Fe transport